MAILREQPRPRRRIHWQTPITLVVLLGMLVGGAWWGWNSLTESTAEQACVQTVLPDKKLLPKDVVVNVYNAGARSGTAKATADLLKRRGFNIGKVQNEPNDEKVPSLAVRGSAATDPEVKLVVAQLAQRAPVVVDGRTDHSVDLILGARFTTLKARAASSVQVPGGKACLPVRRTEQPIPSGEAPN